MSRILDTCGPPPAADLVVEPSADEIARFESDGFLSVDRLTTGEELDWLRKVMEYIFDPAHAGDRGAPIDRSGELAPGEETKLQQAFFPEIQVPELLATAHYRNARRYAAALLGVKESRLSGWGHMISKPAGGRAALWHQDHAYWQPELDYYALACWLPLHDVSEDMGAMQFIPGSHKRGLLDHHHADHPRYNVLEVAEPVDVHAAVACPLKAGGATFHHYHTLHYTAPNVTSRPRLAFPMEFQVRPELRENPREMPWIDEFRAAVGEGPLVYVADGEVVTVDRAG